MLFCLSRAGDVQVEFVMLDPYVRATLAHDGAGRFSTRVKVPDTYGVFKWVLDYRRLGYTYIEMTGGWVGGCGEVG
jgi:oligosaccharyltransferase complex subunit beta